MLDGNISSAEIQTAENKIKEKLHYIGKLLQYGNGYLFANEFTMADAVALSLIHRANQLSIISTENQMLLTQYYSDLIQNIPSFNCNNL